MGGVRPKTKIRNKKKKKKKKGSREGKRKETEIMFLNARICFPNFSKISDNG